MILLELAYILFATVIIRLLIGATVHDIFFLFRILVMVLVASNLIIIFFLAHVLIKANTIVKHHLLLLLLLIKQLLIFNVKVFNYIIMLIAISIVVIRESMSIGVLDIL